MLIGKELYRTKYCWAGETSQAICWQSRWIHVCDYCKNLLWFKTILKHVLGRSQKFKVFKSCTFHSQWFNHILVKVLMIRDCKANIKEHLSEMNFCENLHWISIQLVFVTHGGEKKLIVNGRMLEQTTVGQLGMTRTRKMHDNLGMIITCQNGEFLTNFY